MAQGVQSGRGVRHLILEHQEVLTFPCLSTTGRSPVMSTTVEGSASLAPPSIMKSTPCPTQQSITLRPNHQYCLTYHTVLSMCHVSKKQERRAGPQCREEHVAGARGDCLTSDPSAEVKVLPTTVGSTSHPASAPSKVALVHSRGRSSRASSACNGRMWIHNRPHASPYRVCL